jgi:hypothetical protein
MIDSGFETTALELLAQISRRTADLLPYKSIQGVFYQNPDATVDLRILSNNSSNDIHIDGGVLGSVYISFTGDTEINRFQFFISPLNGDCVPNIEFESRSPVEFTLDSISLATQALDYQGFGFNGEARVSFECRFYPA